MRWMPSPRLAGGLHRLHDLQPAAIRAALRRQGERALPGPSLPAAYMTYINMNMTT